MKYPDAIKRFAQTFVDVTEKNVPLVQIGNVHRGGGSKKAETDARSAIVLAGKLVREEDRRLKKVKTGGPTCKVRFRSTRRCRSAAGLT
jgi:hypothetical protein